MKKLLVFIIIITATISFIVPSQTQAAWWNPVSWFSKDKQMEEQPQNFVPDTVTELQTTTPKAEILEKLNTVTPSTNGQFLDTKIIENLKKEIVALKVGLDNLEGRLNNLQKNTGGGVSDILQRVITLEQGKIDTLDILTITNRVLELERKEKITSNELYGDRGINIKISNLEFSVNKITKLENIIEVVCRRVFGGVICPLVSSFPSLEDRIKKLEGGY